MYYHVRILRVNEFLTGRIKSTYNNAMCNVLVEGDKGGL